MPTIFMTQTTEKLPAMASCCIKEGGGKKIEGDRLNCKRMTDPQSRVSAEPFSEENTTFLSLSPGLCRLVSFILSRGPSDRVQSVSRVFVLKVNYFKSRGAIIY